MKYIYWQVQVKVTLCESFHTSIRIRLQDKTKLGEFRYAFSGGLNRSSHARSDTRLHRTGVSSVLAGRPTVDACFSTVPGLNLEIGIRV